MRPPIAFFAVLVILTVCLGSALLSGKTKAEMPPDWSLKDLDGKTIQLSDYKGKIVILNFWATWCPPCIAEIPDFIGLEKKYQGKDVVIIGLSVDEDPPAMVAKFVKKAGMNYPVVIATSEVTEKYGAENGIPLTLIISPDGTVTAKHLGIVTTDYLEGNIKKLLPASPAH
jgi:cytochrome c biogenesis protein CcmG/thiol:disulfide interchange protein DsbE